MYIWVGINIDDQLKKIRSKISTIESQKHFNNSCLTLPLHISLKLSFKIKDEMYNEIIKDIENYYNTLSKFEIEVKNIEKHDSIIWIRMKRNDIIDRIHDELNNLLLCKYSIPLHEYDTDYIFHTTLFMCDGKEKFTNDNISFAYEEIKKIELPKTILLNNFIIGKSDTGELGTYSVIKSIIK